MRIELDYNCPYETAPAQLAVLLTYSKGDQVLLPPAMSLRGPYTRDVTQPNFLYLQGWSIDHGTVKGEDKTGKRKGKTLFYGYLDEILKVSNIQQSFMFKTLKWYLKQMQLNGALDGFGAIGNYIGVRFMLITRHLLPSVPLKGNAWTWTSLQVECSKLGLGFHSKSQWISHFNYFV